MKDDKEIIEDMKLLYKSYKRTERFSYRKTLLFPIDHYSIEVAKILCLNNYEIAQLQYKYLEFWIKNPEFTYIPADQLFDAMDVKYLNICKYYFSIYHEHVTFDLFLQFVCLFTFGTNEKMAKIYLSICGIQTNMAVNQDQALMFMSSFNETAADCPNVQQFIKAHQNGVSLSEIIVALESLPEIAVPLSKLKKGFIKNVFGVSDYWDIVQRRNILDNSSSDITNESTKYTETCTSKFYRVFIQKRPPMYYTEYRAKNETYDPNKTIESLLLRIRERYGYSRRKVNSTPTLNRSPAVGKAYYTFNSQIDSPNRETRSRVNTLSLSIKPVRHSREDPLIVFNEVVSRKSNSSKRSSTVYPSSE